MAAPTLPAAFIQQMQALLGADYIPFEQSLLNPSRRSIRVHPKKWNKPLNLPTVPWYEYGYWLNEEAQVTYDPLFHAGTYYVQEASSMFLAQMLNGYLKDKKELRVLDLCAAPGGKSTLLCDLLNEEHLLISNEVIKSRVGALDENLLKWGYNNVVVTNNDPADFARMDAYFDIIVVDAPCSGEGMFRKDPEAMNEWDEAHVDLCCSRQKRILSDIWPALKPGGIMIYSTCTFNRKENEENIQWLHTEWKAEPVALDVPAFEGVIHRVENGFDTFRFYPHQVSGEGFFIAAVRKPSTEDVVYAAEHRSVKHSKHTKDKTIIPEQARQLLTKEDLFIFQHKETFRAISDAYKEDIQRISASLRIIRAGTPLGSVKGKDFLPDMAAALSIHLNADVFPSVELSGEEALKYLSKEEFSLQTEARGWTLMRYQTIPLGWIKAMPNRFNSYFPSEWRIRNKWNGSAKKFKINEENELNEGKEEN